MTLQVPAADSPASAKPEPNPVKAGEKERFVTIDFNNVDIEVFIKFISELTGKNFVIDNRVKGKVTITSPARISVDEAYRVFESVLEVNGFATVPAGKVTKIVPSPDARGKDIETRINSQMRPLLDKKDDTLITQLIPLTYASAEEIKRLFTPLISKNSAILAYPATNTLIITDAYSNIQRLTKILKAIDLPGIGQEISVIPLVHAGSEKMVKTLQEVFKQPKVAKSVLPQQETAQFVSDERTNTIIAMASENDMARIKKLIEILDKQTPRGKGKIQVYYLENAIAEDTAKVLQELPSKKSNAKSNEAPIVSEEVKVTADKATNSLIIMADAEDYLVIEDIIQKLDIPRSMVYIESLIMEVNVNKNFNLGIKWSVFGETSVDGKSAAIGGRFSPDGSAIGTGDLAQSGMALGIISSDLIEFTLGGIPISLPNLGAVANAFKGDEDVHILSTPQILTTDNEEAKIIVGRNIPFKTKTTTSSDLNETFNSIEYKDVGLTLKITPHISKDRLVRLQISQELTALTGSPEDVTDQPSTLKRSVETTVIVKDQNTIVIGGLIDDNITNSQNQVPCLGSIPLMGRLFSSESKSNQKTNLYIFITPRVIKSPAEAQAVLNEKQAEINVIHEGNIKLFDTDGKINRAPFGDASSVSPSGTK
jgi:general secretion pathway protein D